MAVPAFLAVAVLLGLGLSTEGRAEFEQRTSSEGSGSDLEFDPQFDPDEGSSGTERFEPSQRGEPTETSPLERGDGPSGQVTGEGAEITIVGEDGDIVVRLGEDGRPVLLTPNEGEAVSVDPDDAVAIRVTEDGTLEVVPIDEIGPDDTVLVPADGGFDLIRPDGSRVEFRTGGENDGITATELTPEGQRIELEPNPDGSVTLSDGTTVGPIDFAEDGGPIERFIDRTRNLPWPWVFGGLALLAAASIALAVHLHRNRPTGGGLDLGRLAGPDIPSDRFEEFLATLARDPDPSRAIRVGFSVAERGLGGVAPRRADETPFEWHQRIEQATSNRPDGATGSPESNPVGPLVGRVCDLFARARFAPGEATEDDRRDLIETLRRLHGVSGRGGGPWALQDDPTQPAGV